MAVSGGLLVYGLGGLVKIERETLVWQFKVPT